MWVDLVLEIDEWQIVDRVLLCRVELNLLELLNVRGLPTICDLLFRYFFGG